MSVYVGTAGWSYPRGAGKWDGVFYPPALADRDKLAFYAQYFNAVEVNSSFYRPLSSATAKAWVDRTPAEFRFCTKLYNKFTHPKMYEEASGQVGEISEADFQTLRESLEPLASSGKLGALLAQFPASFKADESTLSYLDDLIQRLSDYPLAVELRHRSWSESPQARNLLEEYGVAWTMIDEPKFKTSIRNVPLTSRLAYFRFHGRNYEQWWRGDNESRYNYLYSPREQARLAADVKQVGGSSADAYAFYNNHYGAKAVVNAVQLKNELGQAVTGTLPKELLKKYPELRDIVGIGTEPGATGSVS